MPTPKRSLRRSVLSLISGQERREAVRLRYLDGVGVEEIAQRLGKSRAAVAGLLRRGLADLRSCLAP